MMRFFSILVAVFLIEGCASSPPPDPVDVTLIDDFVATAQLEQTDRIDRLTPLDKWYVLNNRYVALRNPDGDFLFHLRRRCDELAQQHYIRFTGTDGKGIQLPWSRFSQCRIRAIYKLSEGQARELFSVSGVPLVMKRAAKPDQ